MSKEILSEKEQKYNKLLHKLGESIYTSYRSEIEDFLGTLDGNGSEDVLKLIELLDYLSEQDEVSQDQPSTTLFTQTETIRDDSEIESDLTDDADISNDAFDESSITTEIGKQLYGENIDYLKSEHVDERLNALNRIAYVGNVAFFKRICEWAMKDESPLVRAQALRLIARKKGFNKFDLFSRALADEDETVRQEAIKYVVDGDKKQIPVLLLPSLKDSVASIRALAIKYLGLYGGTNAVSYVLDSVNDSDPIVRKSVLEVLSIIRPPEVAKILRQMAKDESRDVAKAAEQALLRLSNKSVPKVRKKTPIVQEEAFSWREED